MLPKNRRIPRKTFTLLSKSAKAFKNNVFLLRFTILDNQKQSKFGFSVSKKVAKKAVIRNKLRRMGYRLIESCIDEIKNGILASFSFLKQPKNAEETLKALESILEESKLIK